MLTCFVLLSSSHLVQCGCPELISMANFAGQWSSRIHLFQPPHYWVAKHATTQQQWRFVTIHKLSSSCTKLVSCECCHCLVSLGKNICLYPQHFPHQHYWPHNCEFPECLSLRHWLGGARAALTLWSSGLSSDRSISVLFVLHSQLWLMKYSSMEMVLSRRFMSFSILRERPHSWCSASSPLPLPPPQRWPRVVKEVQALVGSCQ